MKTIDNETDLAVIIGQVKANTIHRMTGFGDKHEITAIYLTNDNFPQELSEVTLTSTNGQYDLEPFIPAIPPANPTGFVLALANLHTALTACRHFPFGVHNVVSVGMWMECYTTFCAGAATCLN